MIIWSIKYIFWINTIVCMSRIFIRQKLWLVKSKNKTPNDHTFNRLVQYSHWESYVLFSILFTIKNCLHDWDCIYNSLRIIIFSKYYFFMYRIVCYGHYYLCLHFFYSKAFELFLDTITTKKIKLNNIEMLKLLDSWMHCALISSLWIFNGHQDELLFKYRMYPLCYVYYHQNVIWLLGLWELTLVHLLSPNYYGEGLFVAWG